MTGWREQREIERQTARRNLAQGAGRAWAEMLMAHQWQSMVTHTFVDHVGWEQAHNTFLRWTRGVDKLTGYSLKWARATERQRRGVLHFHSLVDRWLPPYAITADQVKQRRHQLEELWTEAGGGFSRIDPYTPERAIYCTKYIAKGGDMDLGGDWGNKLQPRLRLI